MAKRYLDESEQLDETTTKRFNEILSQSLQEIMALQNSDGSFNLWGTSHNADGWNKFINLLNTMDYLDLTAYIVKLLAQYKATNLKFNDSVIKNAMNYIKKQQKLDGRFENNGNAQFRDLERYSGLKGVSLTAYVLIGILESEYLKNNYQSVVDKGLQFIDTKYFDVVHDGTNYEKAMTFYLYVLAGKNNEQLLKKLDENALKRNGEVFWEFKDKTHSSTSMQVEVSSYVALGFIKLLKYDDAKPIIKFLMSKRNPKGGFETTTDTVLGLQALTEISKALYSKDTKINITLESQNNKKLILTVGKHQQRLVSDKLSSLTRHVNVSATGVGVANLQVSCQYKIKMTHFVEYFEISTVAKKQNQNSLKLNICVKTMNRKTSNMAIMEVNLPSGYQHHHGPAAETDNLKVDFLIILLIIIFNSF